MKRRQRAFTLLELLGVLVLMVVFAAIANPVLRWSIRTLAAPPSAAVAGRLDRAVATLRRDVWQAAKLSAPSPHDLTVVGVDGRTVTWHIGPGAVLQRDDQAWPGLFPDASVAVDGAAVVLTLPEGHDFRGGIVTLPSQAMLIGRGS